MAHFLPRFVLLLWVPVALLSLSACSDESPGELAQLAGPASGVSASPGDASATVVWTPPESDGGSPITGYTVTSFPGEHAVSVGGDARTATIEGLTNGTPYTFTVAAVTAAGQGPDSAPSAPVTPRTSPGAPAGVVASPGDASATVAWTPPESDGGSPITGYTVVSLPGELTLKVAGDVTVATFEALTNGTPYTFTVSALNEAGEGAASEPSEPVTPRTVPQAPEAVSASPGDASATVTWTPPESDGGGPIAGYTLVASPGEHALNVEEDVTTATIEGLTNGTPYTFTVFAFNDAGEGPASEPSEPVTPRSVPTAPTAVVASPEDASAVVSWSPPESDGGAPVDGYTVVAFPGEHTQSVEGDVTTATIGGLTNGTPYTFTVVASNEAGEGPPSEPSQSVTPRAVPGAPTAVVARPEDTSVTVSWVAPESDGGSPITGYTVVSSPGEHTRQVDADVTTTTMEGLTNGTPYSFRVAASNDAGEGAFSEPSDPVIPLASPSLELSSFTATPSALADGEETITLRLTLIGADGAPLSGRPVSFSSPVSSDVFTAEQGETQADGTFTSKVTSTVPGERLFTATFGFTAQATFLELSLLCTGEPGLASLPWQYPTGQNPRESALGDFNDDGILDLAVANIGSNTVSVMPGRGDGSFGEKTDFATGAAPRSLETADIDGDGHLDLIVGHRDDNTVGVYAGKGDGTFLSPSEHEVGSKPLSLAVGDFNDDGLLDIAVANRGDLSVSVLLADEDAPSGFSRQDYDTEGEPFDIQVGDMNGDGNLDIVVANISTDSISVLLGDGLGDFPSREDYATSPKPASLAIGDVNGDDSLDVVVAFEGDRFLGLLLGNDEGRLTVNSPYYEQYLSSADVSLADVNGDGFLDIVLALNSPVGSNLRVWRGLGNGSFMSELKMIAGSQARSIAVADLDGDSHLDLVVVRAGASPGALVMRGSGSGSFSPPGQFEAGELAYDVATGDFNADGHLDLVVANRGKDTFYGSVSVLLGRGDGAFTKQRDFVTGVRPRAVEVADLDGDGHLDLIIAHEGDASSSGSVSVFFGQGNGFFNRQEDYSVGEKPYAITSADFDGDGHLDIAVVNHADNTLSVLLGDGGGGFLHGAGYETGRRPGSIEASDINGDGVLDLLVTNWGEAGGDDPVDGSLGLFFGVGDGTFHPQTEYPEVLVGGWPIDVAVADFNRDGFMDIAVAEVLDDKINIMMGIGQGLFVKLYGVATNSSPNEVHVTDFNNDGIPDLVVVNDLTSSLNVLIGLGNGVFEEKQTYMVDALGKTGAKAIAVGDFNADGIPDVAATMLRAETHLNNGAVHVLLGICE